MRLTAKLVQVAAIVAAATGCGGSTTSHTTPANGDGGKPGDAQPDAIIGCGGCGCGGDGAAPPSYSVTAAQACKIIEDSYAMSNLINTIAYGPACEQLCQGQYNICEVPQSYVNQVQALNPDGGTISADGGATLDCPTTPAMLTVTCTVNCTGRLTEGYGAPEGTRTEGERLAAMTYLEAVSVHAFERLERELDAHRAPPDLLRAARRARRDEVRHTAMTTRLARRHGASFRLPEAPGPARTRTLFEVALENAVEGCIRETYGAVQGLVEAETSRDATMRRAMKSIAADECRHAELAWAVHAWAMPRLTEDERRAVERAMKDAVAEIAARDPRTASLLFSEERTAIA
jgi:hypothetical protein